MKASESIRQELTELNSSLVPFNGMPVFTVPESYFENFPAIVLNIVRSRNSEAARELSELSPLLAGISRKMPFAVPDGYFVNEDSEAVLPAILKDHDRKMPFAIPAGYFQNLPGQILRSVQPAKVVQMKRTSWMKMAAAAVVTGLVVISSFFYLRKDSNNGDQPQAWVKTELKNVSDQELEKFITTTDAVHEDQSLAQASVKKTEVRTMLQDVSVNEMEDFLEQVPNDDEELSVIN